MLTAEEIVVVRFTEEMVNHGIDYAKKSWPFTFNRMGLRTEPRILNICKGVLVEKAFIELLRMMDIGHDLTGATHYTRKDRYDVHIAGDRWDIKSLYIHPRYFVENLSPSSKGWLLDCPALVPTDQLHARSLRDDDVYIFPFLTGFIDERPGEPKLFPTSANSYLIGAPFAYDWWNRRHSPGPIGRLELTCVGARTTPCQVEIGGQDESKNLIVETIEVNDSPVQTENAYDTLLYLHPSSFPNGSIRLKADKGCEDTWGPHDWADIYISDGLIYFAGAMTKGDFRDLSREIKRFTKTKINETKTNNNMLMVQDLDPIGEHIPQLGRIDCEVL